MHLFEALTDRLAWAKEALSGKRKSVNLTSDNGETFRPATVITGATEGIGFELAKQFASAGDNILLIARGEEKLQKVSAQLAKAHPGQTFGICSVDLTSHDCASAIDRALSESGLYCDVLVNNAGRGAAGDFSKIDPVDLTAGVELNIQALTQLTRHYLPDMLDRRSGGILNISSLAGYVPGPYQSGYYAAKAYVTSLSRALSSEIVGTRVRMTAITPGPVETEFHDKAAATSALYTKVLPLISAERVARVSYRNFMWGRSLSTPGMLPKLMVLSVRVLPHALTVPFMNWLLLRRPESKADRHLFPLTQTRWVSVRASRVRNKKDER